MSKENGGPAFPNRAESYDNGFDLSGGMTLRQWYAGKALEGLIARGIDQKLADGRHAICCETRAELAFVYADAMIAEGAK